MGKEEEKAERIKRIEENLTSLSLADLIALHGHLESNKETIGRSYLARDRKIDHKRLSEWKAY